MGLCCTGMSFPLHRTVTKKRSNNPWVPPRPPFLHRHVVSPHRTVTKKATTHGCPQGRLFCTGMSVPLIGRLQKKATTHGCPQGRLFCTGMSFPFIGRLQKKKHNPWVPPRPPFFAQACRFPSSDGYKKSHNPWVPPRPPFLHRHVVSPHRTVTQKATTHGCPQGRLFL